MTRNSPSALLALALAAAGLAGCGSTMDRLSQVGKTPALSAIDNPTTQPGYRPVQMPMPTVQPVAYSPNSLWQSGSRTFFKDQRARNVGDILTVQVDIADKAAFDNSSERTRAGSDTQGIGGALGTAIDTIALPAGMAASDLASDTSTSSYKGTGAIDRSEDVQTNVAAVITQVLPNGNLVIEGRQEVRVNMEVRELIIAGVVRPEDIAADNTIESAKIAEARISYGGRGQISDVQQPRTGQQVLDILLPF